MILLRIVYFIVLAVEIWALVDAAIRPAVAFPAAGKLTKPIWLGILAAAVLLSWVPFLILVGAVAAIVYLVDVRPAIREITGRGGNRGGW